MSSPNPSPPTSARTLTADPITHLVLNLCARTEDITRDRTSPDAPWRLKLRDQRVTDQRALGNLEIALTALEAARLIAWYDVRDESPSLAQYVLERNAGQETLQAWDAEILAGGAE